MLLRSCLFLIFLITYSNHSYANYEIINHEIISQDNANFDCHGSSLVEASSGVLCAVWKGGEGKHDGIWISKCVNEKWSTPEQIVSAGESVCWTPNIVKLPSGELNLFYRLGSNPRHAVGFLKRSLDNGVTWSQAEILPAGILGPVKSKPVFDDNGDMICGSSIEAGDPEDEFKATACWIEIYSDQSKSWSKHGPIEIPGKRFGAIEPAIFKGENGVLKIMCRDRSNRIGLEGWLWQGVSHDNGRTWSQLERTPLPNPDSGFALVDLGKGRVIVFYNHSHTKRYPLTMALSTDYGVTWNSILDLENVSGEVPSAIYSSDGCLHVTYAWQKPGTNQHMIKHVVIMIE